MIRFVLLGLALPGISLAAGVDNDADGYDFSVDCDDNDARTFPGAYEACDGVDNDCDGVVDDNCNPGTGPTGPTGGSGGVFGSDADGDGYSINLDCNDSDPNVYPNATETCDGIDNDCDGVVDDGCGNPVGRDADGDGYGYDDCDDYNASTYPGATEQCNLVDDDCDGVVDEGCNTGDADTDADADSDTDTDTDTDSNTDNPSTDGTDTGDRDTGFVATSKGFGCSGTGGSYAGLLLLPLMALFGRRARR